MKYAAMMRYGGELGDAAECDYEDWKYLKPLCPECGESVYLRIEANRISKRGLPVYIPPHWSHFPAKDPTLASGCESRVDQYSREEIQRRAAKATGQRLKLFQRWFFTMIKDLPITYSGDQSIGDFFEFHQYASSRSDYRECCNSLYEAIRPWLQDPEAFQAVFDPWVEESNFGTIGGNITPTEAPALFLHISTLSSKLDRRLHKQICKEACFFLGSRQGSEFVKGLSFQFVFQHLRDHKIVPVITQDFASNVFNHVVQTITLVPWAQRLEEVSRDNPK